ncbi:MAG TPA: hypothetical protein VK095_16615 [Beutenbergiaceae bacterium]|nr:hypothetical protein [Beutenbergiaceae bacterium]
MERFGNAMFLSAVLFTLGALSITFDRTGVQWMWSQVPVVGIALGLFGLFFWVAFARRVARDRAT